jgi:hypothetical protein
VPRLGEDPATASVGPLIGYLRSTGLPEQVRLSEGLGVRVLSEWCESYPCVAGPAAVLAAGIG